MNWLTDKVLIAFIGACMTSATALFHLIDSKNKAEAELNAQKKYENIITDNLRYKFTCKCD